MFEAIEIISKLFSGKEVKHDGRFFKMETCRLWTLPEKAPPIYIATAGPVTAKRTGQFADGIITVGAPEEKIEVIFAQVRRGRARGRQGPGDDAEDPAAPPLLGRDGRARRSRTPSPNGRTAA